ncbi:M23 family metallopeptidase [Streptomyces smyrnaeus]|uniref:M23 family metallopeptidase n=1 Tax=Streptomyces smyrnaeus TaxID=1387713 RepID=A0ABS3Y105_9ACTN|nr:MULTISPECIES: M23 family metallopeptidase [Streptomyces]MBO8201264.1 M23 family metallopeptidase [Streptomyces smyrnaeus]MBQ0864234.1 M23 family metallopeptidase [Streptomyces sp. RK75]MBQ1124555.1 M23 family metallopeptidase [Streptomyces sp. B15]MBQ1161100.1 M23 family metallopeptidase [Streptomyces sp. A73]
MAFTRATGKHRRPSKARSRAAGGAAGIAGLATVGVVGSIASPAFAASEGQKHTPVQQDAKMSEVVGGPISETLDEQAYTQALRAEQAKAEADAKAEAAKAKAEAKRKADEARRKAAAEKAEKERDAKLKAAREAERAKLNAYVAPVEGSYVSTGYKQGGGMWSSGSHTGIDFHAGMNTPVRSVAAGEVVEAGNGGAYGNNIVIKHKDGTYTQYGHLNSIGVSVGQQVKAGQQIGLSGSTGNSSGPHLHFEARTSPDYGSDIDPLAYLRQHGVKI